MGAILSFLSGSAFRMVWGEVSSWLNARQEHKHEKERMLLQDQLDANQHARNLAAQRLQVELGHKTIAVQADADVTRIETEAWRSAIERMQTPTGVRWIDGWNGSIRPAFASGALILWMWYEFSHMRLNAWAISVFSLDLIAIVIGFYFADRSLSKRGK
jgi:hypothetical protein